MSRFPKTPQPPRKGLNDPRSTGGASRPRLADIQALRGTFKG